MYLLTVHNGISNDDFPIGETTIKQYPTKEQCITWLHIHGYIYKSSRKTWIDNRFRVITGEGTNHESND